MATLPQLNRQRRFFDDSLLTVIANVSAADPVRKSDFAAEVLSVWLAAKHRAPDRSRDRFLRSYRP